MAEMIWSPAVRDTFIERAKTLRIDSKPAWGRMSATAVLDEERLALVRLFDQLGGLTANAVLQPHPAFGVLSYRDYGALMAKHTQHHFRQFGI